MRPASTHSVKLILNIAFSLSAVGIVVRASSAIKEIVFASAFGVSAETDAFVLAFTYATFLPSVLGGALGTALIAALPDSGVSLRGRSLMAVAKWIGLGSLVCAVFVYAIAPHALSLLFSLRGTDLAKATIYARVLAPLGATLLVSSAMNALLNSEKQFYIAGFAPLATPVAIMFAIFLAAREFGVEAVAWGTVLGGVAEMSILGVRLFSQRGMFFRPRTNTHDVSAGWWFWRSVGVLSFADAIAAISPMVDQVFLAKLETGAITQFSYASKINSVLIGIFGTAFSVAIYPYLSDLAAQRNADGLRRLTWRLAAVVLPIAGVATSLVYVYSYELVDLLFRRGNFTTNDAVQVSAIQQVFCFQLVFYVALLLTMPVLNALQASHFVFYMACIGLASNALFDWVFYRPFGAPGIALSSVLTSALSLVCAILFVRAALARMAEKAGT